MWADGFEKPLSSKAVVNGGWHPVISIGLFFLGIPEMMRDEFEQQGFGRWPGQRLSGRCQAPGFEIGQIRCQRPECVGTHSGIDEVAQGLDVLVGQKFGKFVTTVNGQNGRNCVELFGAPLDGCL